MSESQEAAPSGSEGKPLGPDPTAVALALNGASRSEADAFLSRQRLLIEEQHRLVGLQANELAHELDLRHWSLWVHHLSGVLKLTFEVGLSVAAICLAGFIAIGVWNAAHSEGLVIEPFSVPPDMASRGLTGQVLANQLLDQLTAMQKSTQSSRPAKSYVNSWGNDLKVEIPETGISIDEAYRFLRRWLGHEVHVNGEVFRASAGIALATRTSNSSGAIFKGTEPDLDQLISKSAAHIYRVTQPDRYARWIVFPRPGLTPRFAEARAVLNQMAQEASPTEKPWAWFGLAVLTRFQGDYRASSNAYAKAMAGNAFLALPAAGLSAMEGEISHSESSLSAARTAAPLLTKGSDTEIDPTFLTTAQTQNLYQIAFLLGDYREALRIAQAGVNLSLPRSLNNRASYQNKVVTSLSLMHDGAAARNYLRNSEPPQTPLDTVQRAITRLRVELELGRYQAALALEPDVAQTIAKASGAGFVAKDTIETQFRPLLATAKAKVGDIAGALALIAASPVDCYDCARYRGRIAAMAGDSVNADEWFVRAVRAGPSLPSAYTDWGQAFLERGKPDEAIAQFRLASQKGPHFADPLEKWGEALMAKNQSHRALAKFAEAEKYAPNWGRLHLKWGQALDYSGNKEEASKRFARAAQLDLSPSEETELAKMK